MSDIEAIKARRDADSGEYAFSCTSGVEAHHDRATLLSALSAAEARAEAAEAMLLVFMAAPPDFTVDQARAAIAALRPTNQEPRHD